MKLADIAQAISDQFFQDYLDNESFFSMSDFMLHAANYYNTMLNAEFQQQRVLTKRETGFSLPEISATWLTTEKITPLAGEDDTWYIETSMPIFNFTFDGFGYALMPLSGGGSCILQKLSNDEWFARDLAPKTSFLFYLIDSANRILFDKSPCVNPIRVQYVPAASINTPELEVPDPYASEMITKVLGLMIASRNGTVVNETDDLNKNKVIEKEANLNTPK